MGGGESDDLEGNMKEEKMGNQWVMYKTALVVFLLIIVGGCASPPRNLGIKGTYVGSAWMYWEERDKLSKYDTKEEHAAWVCSRKYSVDQRCIQAPPDWQWKRTTARENGTNSDSYSFDCLSTGICK